MKDNHAKSLLAELYDNNKARLFGIAYSILQNRQDAEDALQDVFLRLISIVPKLQTIPPEKRTAFLTNCIVNRSKDILRMKKLRNETDLEENLFSTKSERDLVQIDQKDLIHRFLETLNEKQRAILIYHFYYGMKYREIAAIMNMRTPAVQKTVSRLRKQMREYAEVNK